MRAIAMQPPIIFDTLQYSKRLQKEGVPVNQADVQAEMIKEIFDDHVATKADIRALQKDMIAMEERLINNSNAMEERLSNRITETSYKITLKLIGVFGSLMLGGIVILGFMIHLKV